MARQNLNLTPVITHLGLFSQLTATASPTNKIKQANKLKRRQLKTLNNLGFVILSSFQPFLYNMKLYAPNSTCKPYFYVL